MNPEELGIIAEELIRIAKKLNCHRLEMAKAEPLDDVEDLAEITAHLASHDNTNFDHSGRLDIIEKRLNRLEGELRAHFRRPHGTIRV